MRFLIRLFPKSREFPTYKDPKKRGVVQEIQGKLLLRVIVILFWRADKMVELTAKGNGTEYKVVYGCPCDCGQDVDGGHTKREINKLLKEQMENPLKPPHDLFIMCVDKVVWKDWDIYDEDIEWLHPLQDASLLDGALYDAPCPIHEALSFSIWKMLKKVKEMN